VLARSEDPAVGADFATIGVVHLDVTDLERSLRFWRDDIGLRVRDEDGPATALGTGRDTLLVLHPTASVPAHPAYAGLYHVALHLPDEAQFAVILRRLIDRRVPARPTDHTMSKAIYLADPDGLGLELTLETPQRGLDVTVGPAGPSIRDARGRRRSLAEPLDLDEVLAHLPAGPIPGALADGTTVGHVHLQVSAVEPARRFYRERLGFLEHFGVPGLISNLHTGGAFPHRLAVNAFSGRGLRPAPDGMARLRRYEIRYADPRRLEDVLRGLPDAVEQPGGWLVRDPSDTAIVLSAPPG
jgi:catechol 2,3-dioxygenase